MEYLKTLSVVRLLAEKHSRIFSVYELRSITQSLHLKDSYLPQLINRALKEGSLERLYRGVYTLNQSLIAGSPITEYEIANHIARPSAVAFWSAFAIHQLTDQVLRDVFIIAPREDIQKSPQSLFRIRGGSYKIFRVKRENFFGVEKKFLMDIPIFVTDFERTLIDGIMRPDLCGGFRDVLEAYREGWERVNINKLISYGERFGVSVLKRIGWICDQMNLKNPYMDKIKKIPCANFYKLDTSREAIGLLSKTWHLRENL